MSPADVPGGLLLDYQLDSGVAVVTLTGGVDVSTSPSLRDGLLRVINDEVPRGLVVNLASVSFIDSTGVGVLVGIWHRARAAARCLALAAPSGQARSVLEATGLATVLPVYDTRAQAVRACQDAGGK